MSNSTPHSRYPGIRSFEQDESKIFFGREKEIKELSSLINVERFVVLFAKSGTGKTSLLNAGVLPLLEEKEDYQPIHVRFQNTKKTPEQLLLGKVEEKMQNLGIDKMVNSRLETWCEGRKVSTWEYLKACTIVMSYLPATPLLILDQFEEFFTHTDDSRNLFTAVLADIIFGRVPLAIQKRLQEKEHYNQQWATPLNWKLVFSIRSDRLSLLDNLSKDIPAILNNRYQLNALNTTNAKAAILAPAKSDAYEFTSTIFGYSALALEEITSNLSNEKAEIESFQLQLICGNLEERVIADNTIKEITPEHIGGEEGIKKMLNDYYIDKINNIGTQEEQILAKNLIEKGLITDGTRDSLTDAAVSATYNISASLLEKLLATRIIKPESTHLGEGKAYEISHDTLVEPILSSFRIREAEEQAEELKAEKRKRRRATLGFFIVSILFLIAVAGIIVAIIQTNKAQAAQQEAEAARDQIVLQQEKNQKIVDAFYFYDGKLALAYKKDDQFKGKYGFINKEGEVVIDYKYEEALPFDEATGLAKVKKLKTDSTFYLIDTDGNEYLLAQSLNELNEQTKALDLSFKGLIEMPLKVLDYPQLEILALNNNKLTSLPDNFSKLKNLTRLHLWNNQLELFPIAITNLSKLEILGLGYNKLIEIPVTIENLEKLSILVLCNNKLIVLPEEITNLTHLTYLDLNSNLFVELNLNFTRLNKLIDLSLCNNQLKSIPKEITNLPQLKHLFLDSNYIENIPVEIKSLTQLKYLSLSNNQLSRIPKEIKSLTQLKSLYLDNNKLNTIPKEIGKLSQLKFLYLSDNELKSIPQEIGKLSQLKDFPISNNKLQNIPVEIGKLSQLTRLYLGNNELKSIPKEIGKLSQLRKLTINSNQLKNIPKEIGKLSKLTYLSLYDNQLKSIPVEIGNLSKLEELYLGSNQLKSIPKNIGKLSKLTHLSLYSNQIDSIPQEINSLSQLKELSLFANPIPKEKRTEIEQKMPWCKFVWY